MTALDAPPLPHDFALGDFVRIRGHLLHWMVVDLDAERITIARAEVEQTPR
jgi:hypothetical protein